MQITQREIEKNYYNTIEDAINKAVELTKNQNKDLHAEIIIRDTGIVSVSKLSTYFFTLFVNSKIIAIICVYGWQDNLKDVYFSDYDISVTKAQKIMIDIKTEINENDAIGNLLNPQIE